MHELWHNILINGGNLSTSIKKRMMMTYISMSSFTKQSTFASLLLGCLSHVTLFGNSALSYIKMNVCGCILLERGIYTCTLLACALLRI